MLKKWYCPKCEKFTYHIKLPRFSSNMQKCKECRNVRHVNDVDGIKN